MLLNVFLITLSLLIGYILYTSIGESKLVLAWIRGVGRNTSPAVAYKQARLDLTHTLPFAGVVGKTYGVEAHTDLGLHGFHSFKTFQQAFDHEQQSNVILEVLGSGVIQEHQNGYIFSRQRVLQVLVGNCQLCPPTKQPSTPAQLWSGSHWVCQDCAGLISKRTPKQRLLSYQEVEEALQQQGMPRVLVSSYVAGSAIPEVSWTKPSSSS